VAKTSQICSESHRIDVKSVLDISQPIYVGFPPTHSYGCYHH